MPAPRRTTGNQKGDGRLFFAWVGGVGGGVGWGGVAGWGGGGGGGLAGGMYNLL